MTGRRRRGAMRVLGWNALLLAACVALAALAGEVYFRLTVPFLQSTLPLESVPNVGRLRPPDTEIHHTNGLDFWTVSRTNSLGFLDREPPNPERAAASCHVSMVGDSVVEAKEVPVHQKFHVRLEELAAGRLPHLRITTSAFGMGDTGQVQQLPFYDRYARRLHPKLLVLVFVPNDFINNAPVSRALQLRAWDRKHRLEPTVKRRPDGKLELAWSRLQDPLPSRFPSVSPTPASWAAWARKEVVEGSRLALWLRAKKKALFPPDREDWFVRDAEALRRQPGYAALLEGWRPTTRGDMVQIFTRRELPPLFEEALEYTAFALEQFEQRADRDGAKLVILASQDLKIHGTRMFERMGEIAATLAIPVIDQADYILRQGATLTDARWPHDAHWNPAGHQWAAEALLEYIEQRPDICGG